MWLTLGRDFLLCSATLERIVFLSLQFGPFRQNVHQLQKKRLGLPFTLDLPCEDWFLSLFNFCKKSCKNYILVDFYSLLFFGWYVQKRWLWYLLLTDSSVPELYKATQWQTRMGLPWGRLVSWLKWSVIRHACKFVSKLAPRYHIAGNFQAGMGDNEISSV